MTGERIHILAPDHKRSHHNPGEHGREIVDHGLAYRTALCGAVRYSRLSGDNGRWRGQFDDLYCVDPGNEEATCKTCIRISNGSPRS